MVVNHCPSQKPQAIADADKIKSTKDFDTDENAEGDGVTDAFNKNTNDNGVASDTNGVTTLAKCSRVARVDTLGSEFYEEVESITEVFHGSSDNNYIDAVVGCSGVSLFDDDNTEAGFDSNIGDNFHLVGNKEYTICDRDISFGCADVTCGNGGKKRVQTTGVHNNQIYTMQKASKFTEEKTNDELEVFHKDKKRKFISFKNTSCEGPYHAEHIQDCIATKQKSKNQLATKDKGNKLIRGTTNVFTKVVNCKKHSFRNFK